MLKIYIQFQTMYRVYMKLVALL